MSHDPFCKDHQHCKDTGACVYCDCLRIRRIREDERAKLAEQVTA